jgi:1-acyl-sn-glycerol-3-phosphate acyltransferase
MSVFKLIAGRFFAFYALLLFIVTILPISIYFFLVDKLSSEMRREQLIHKGFKLWMGFYMPLIACPVRQKGLQNFKQDKNYVVIINHRSLMDIPVSSPGVPAPNKTLAKKSFARIPVFGYIYTIGSVLVDRGNAQSKLESYKAMKGVLNKGLHLTLYPEGTRNKTTEPLLPFKEGAFKIAIETQKDIIPALIKGTQKILPANAPVFWAWPSPVTITFLPSISTKHLALNDIKLLKDKCFEIMKKELVQL